jgi:LPS sulfotransferase NodH
MKPIIITTPRTGATLICKKLAPMVGYKSNLNEFFFVTKHGTNTYEIIDGTVYVPQNGKVADSTWWHHSGRDMQLERLNLIKDNLHDYMIKLQTWELQQPEIKAILSKFDPVFVERRNKLDQVLSYLAMVDTQPIGSAFHHLRDTPPVTGFHFCKTLVTEMLITLRKYYAVKREFKNPVTIYYEDFMQLGGNEYALSKLLNLPYEQTLNTVIDTVETRYAGNREDLIINKDEWLEYKPTLLEKLDKYTIT